MVAAAAAVTAAAAAAAAAVTAAAVTAAAAATAAARTLHHNIFGWISFQSHKHMLHPSSHHPLGGQQHFFIQLQQDQILFLFGTLGENLYVVIVHGVFGKFMVRYIQEEM